MATRTKTPDSKSKAQESKTKAPYTVLARRYRSRDFAEIIGQEPIARTLMNAIKSGRTAHAYLFCGTRGVGKTSMARIFAKALNASDDLKQKDEIGAAILRGDDLDVIEIDGASNRGIDNARELIANAGLHPARCPYKIYIIDEVHMVTRDAFNALLKTMEEPPAHVKFILCTTEPQKVPATIQSRCQRFDFRAIPTAKIAGQLRRILEDEGIKAEDDVVAQIARLGNGSMRDALSIMDRLLAGGDEKLTSELVEQMLGLPDHTLISQLVDAIIASDASGALKAGAELLDSGTTIDDALDMLADHFRTLMVMAASGDAATELLDLSEEGRATAAQQAQHFDSPALVHMIAICDAVSRNAHGSAAARALFDAALVRLSMSQHFADIPALLSGNGMTSAASAARPAANPALEAKKKGQPLDDDSAPTHASTSVVTEIKPPSSAPVASSSAPPAVVSPGDTGEHLWQRVVETAAPSMRDRNLIAHLVLRNFDGQTLNLAVDEGGSDVARYLNTNINVLVDLVKRACGRTVRIQLDTSRVAGTPRAPTAPSLQAEPKPAAVQKALEIFDATIVSVDDVRRST